MSLSETNLNSPDTMPPFTPGQCLLCPNPSPNFSESIIHMQKSHGLFIPHQEHLAVDLETLVEYLYLIIFGYRECIQCGTERATVQAVQQHMIGKGHCRFDISEEDSEFAEFYDFEDSAESSIDEETDQETTAATSSSLKPPLLADEDWIHLPSGKTISKKLSAQADQPFITRLHRRTTRLLSSQLEYSVVEPDEQENSSKEAADTNKTQALSKREKREKAMVTYQLANMTANDRSSLMHLPTSQQRSILAAQHRHEDKMQKIERQRQTRIERKGNKNLYAYWNTETPVYQCG